MKNEINSGGNKPMTSIRQLQAKKFKANYISEMEFVIQFLKDKVKKDEDISVEEAEEAKGIFVENLDRICDLKSEAETPHTYASYSTSSVSEDEDDNEYNS